MSQILVTGEAKIRDIQGPVVANSGVITALDGAASQYVRGDGTLADFPTSSGGGSSVSYYLNSSVSQGTIGGVAYRELSKDPIIGAGTDIAISANGYVANYITDANDPDVVLVPGGNFNCEFYFSVNNNTGNPTTYAELYKYDGTTFTLLGTSAGVPESINQGTTIAPYYFAIPVATAALSVTDRLAIRIYVNVDGRVVTLHTENGHLCQVVTTLSKGMVSLNNLTDQSQFITTGTTGTDFNIASSGDTHTFNLPIASATNTGKLSSSDWSTFNNKVPYTGATGSVDLGLNNLTANNVFGETSLNIKVLPSGSIFSTGYSTLSSLAGKFTMAQEPTSGNLKAFTFDFSAWATNTSRTYTLPDLSGTLALLEGTQTFSGAKTFTENLIITGTGTNSAYTILQSAGTNKWRIGNNYAAGVNTFDIFSYDNSSSPLSINSNGAMTLSANVTTTGAQFVQNGFYLSNANAGARAFYTLMYGRDNGISFALRNGTGGAGFIFQSANGYDYTFPAASGTLALSSDLSAYLPLTGGTLTGNLIINPSTTEYTLSVSTPSTNNTIKLLGSSAGNTSTIGYFSSNGATGYGALNFTPTNTRFEIVNSGSFSIYTSGIERFTVASGGTTTLTGALSGTSATFTNTSTFRATGNAYTNGSIILQSSTGATSTYLTNSGGIFYLSNNGSTDHLQIASTGAATFSSTLAVGTTISAQNGGTYAGSAEFAGILRIQGTGGRYFTSGNGLEMSFNSIYSYNRGTNAYNDLAINDSMVVKGGNGNVGIGVPSFASTNERLVVKGADNTSSNFSLVVQQVSGTDLLRVRNDGVIYTGTAALSPYNLTTGNSANLFVASDGGLLRSTSSLKYKKNVENYTKGLAYVMQLRPVSYNSINEKEDGITYAGLIAEEIHDLGLTEFVQYASDGTPDALAYQNMIALAFKAIQEEDAKVNAQELRIQQLESQIQELKALIAAK